MRALCDAVGGRCETAQMHLELMRDKAREFPEIGEPQSLRTLRAWHCNYRTLEPVAHLTSLTGLVVATYPDASLELLGGLEELRYLFILHLPKIDSIEPIAHLNRLEVLRLHTLPDWDASGRTTQVESLDPLARLPHLRHVELFGVRPADRSLRSLERSPNLESVRVSKYPKAEVARFQETTGLSDRFAPEPWF